MVLRAKGEGQGLLLSISDCTGKFFLQKRWLRIQLKCLIFQSVLGRHVGSDLSSLCPKVFER